MAFKVGAHEWDNEGFIEILDSLTKNENHNTFKEGNLRYFVSSIMVYLLTITFL